MRTPLSLECGIKNINSREEVQLSAMRQVFTTMDWLAEFSLDFFESKGSLLTSIRPVTSSIVPYPHQFKGRILFERQSSCGAMLLADEVGVGKTYTVGHVIRWMIKERNASRILILCPARLVKSKWIPTMRDFGLDAAESYSGRSLKRWLSGDVKRTIMVSSYEKASGAGTSLEQFENDFAQGEYHDIDLVVIDEIHNFTQSAVNRKGLANIVLNLTDSRIGLTATPIWNGLNDFREILQMIKPFGFEQIDIENDLLELGKLSQLCFKLYENNPNREDLLSELQEVNALAEMNLEQKLESDEGRLQLAQALIQSSPFSSWLIRTTAREVADTRQRIIQNPILVDLNQEGGTSFFNPETNKIETTRSEFDTHQEIRSILKHSTHRNQLDSLPSAYSEHLEKLSEDNLSISKKDAQELSNALRELEGGCSKCKKILELLQENLAQEDCRGVVIFTHWHPTFARLDEELGKSEQELDIRFFSANPNLDNEALDEIVMKFQSYEGPKKPVILVTDKFSEGRDLFNANYMIHVDVPQNPLKVEQRIGRIDRMGQQSDTIYVQYVLINQSTEHHQLEILKRRLVQFSTYFGVANSILPDDIGFG